MSQIDSENINETISALLDNEADSLELRRFLKSCEQDPTLLETWERYSLVQAALHESAKPVNASLSQGISEQIELQVPLSAKLAPVQPLLERRFYQDGNRRLRGSGILSCCAA